MILHTNTRSLFPGRMLCLSWALLSIFLAVAQGNTAPRFDMNTTFSLSEDTTVGTWLFQLVAKDQDNDKLFYSITGDQAYFFSVDRSSGNVTLKQTVNYKDTKLIIVDAEVTDNINVPVTTKLAIMVKDCNDNKPIFQNEPYFTEVPENTTIGSSIYMVWAEDDDSGSAGRVSYTIEEVSPNNSSNYHLFYIQYNGTVVLNGSLSYNNKSTFYRIKILAKDGGGLLNGIFVYQNNTAYLSVTVVDVADLDPQFVGAPYTGAVPENCPLGTSVLTVWAIDEDKGVNDAIYYNITNATGLFAINANSGVITVSGPLDREGVPGEEVQLQVVAREENLNIYHQVAQVSTIVTIHIMDTNDNRPQFYSCTYPDCNFSGPPEDNFSGEIEEHASARTPVANLSIVAYDPDKGSNGTFQLSLQGPDALAFSVSPQQVVNEGTVQVLVRNSTLVDYEKSHAMSVEIVANDTGRSTDCCSFATVTIHLSDINDHRPEFSQTDYKLYVMEDSPPGTIVASNITATDPDTGMFGRITYQLLPKSILSTFTVNTTTGTVLVANGSNLDWEFRSVYYATLEATDGGGLSGSTQLEISVVDINNNPPVVTGSYNVFVNENEGIVQVRIQATDKDEPDTNNSRLQFAVVPGNFSSNFSINPDTGVLSTTGPLDREAIPMELNGKMVVTVLVHDLGVPQLNTTVNVTFTVEDKNDNIPKFSRSFYNFSVQEGMEGILVGAVEATDADQTLINNRITFHIEGSNNFVIRSLLLGPGWYQGNLSLVQVLDYEEQKYFNLTVEAENLDSGENMYIDTASVRVNVLDINDEPPVLVPSPPQDINVLENTPLNTSVETLKATDKDTNHSLIFWELDVKCFNDSGEAGSVCQDWFQLEPNGSLIVTSPDIDFEVCDKVELTLRVEDEFTEKGDRYSQNETLRILIVDVNDNPPVFLPITETFVIIPEISPMNLQVAVVRAVDADSGVNSVITFAISSIAFISDNGNVQNLGNVFEVVTTSEEKIYIGSIQVASNLDSSLKGRYQLSVVAEDHGMPPLNSMISFDIYTVDQSYRVKLVFNSPLQEVQANTDKIKVSLRKATQATVYVAAIKSIEDSRSARASEKSVMEAYFTFPNGTALTADQVHMLIQNDPEERTQLINLGLSMIGPVEVQEVDNEKTLFAVIAGLAVAVLLILLLMIGAIIGMRKSYLRKLKAVSAMKVASTFSGNAVQQGPVIPGTNKYNTEGANPVLGFSLNPVMDLEENSSYEVASLNSLDENMVEDPDSDPIIPASKLGTGDPKSQPNNWKEPLKIALEGFNENKPQQPKQPKNTTFSFDNPCLDTTDL